MVVVGIDPDSVLVVIGLGRNRTITTTTGISGLEIKSITTQNTFRFESVWVVNNRNDYDR